VLRQFPSTSFWRLQIIGWSCFYLFVFVPAAPYLKEPGVFKANSLWVLSLFSASWLLRFVCRASLRNRGPWFLHEIHAIAAALLLALVTSLGLDLFLDGLQTMNWGGWLLDFVQNSVVFFLWCNLYFGAKQWQQIAQQSERMLRIESEARQARLNALRYQLNPHFLFNALNAVSTLILDGDSAGANQMLVQISLLLRRALENQTVTEIPLSEEIDFTEQYLAVEQVRLGERLHVDMVLSPETLDALVPVMLLQPLVENAVVHGIASEIDGGTILIQTRTTDSRLLVVIRNSGPERKPSPTTNLNHGIGLKNCVERLEAIYGADYLLAHAWPNSGGCEVSLDLPLRRWATVEG